ncbi:MAG: hypothetical protein ABIL62_20090 [Planctomycetota bacterium]
MFRLDFWLNRYDKPLKRIFQIALSQGCRTILVEDEHEDVEYKSEYNSFYKNLFKKYSDKTQRLHFFASDLEVDDLSNLSKFQSDYLGFCVLRPFQMQKVVNAVIKPVEDYNYPPRWFILCQDNFPVEIKLSGGDVQKLNAKGFPFIQQDGQLGRCAQASLFMLDRFLAPRFGRKAHFVSEIVELANKVTETKSEIPAEGLSPVQISRVLKEIGYNPLVYYYGDKIQSRFSPERVIYHYMESEIPIIIGFRAEAGWHALTVIGHSFEPDMWWALAKGEYYGGPPSGGQYHCSTTWIENFIVHDDNLGPYMTLPKWFIWSKAKDGLMVIVPLPLNVNVQGEDVEIYAQRMVSDPEILNWMANISETDVGKQTKEWEQVFWEHLSNKDLVLRTCLVDSKKFKECYVADHLKTFYKSLHMPDKIWLTEVSIPELFCQFRFRLGEVITDSTTSVRFGHSFLAVHLPGIIATRNANTGKKSFYPIKGDEPFSHVIRSASDSNTTC